MCYHLFRQTAGLGELAVSHEIFFSEVYCLYKADRFIHISLQISFPFSLLHEALAWEHTSCFSGFCLFLLRCLLEVKLYYLVSDTTDYYGNYYHVINRGFHVSNVRQEHRCFCKQKVPGNKEKGKRNAENRRCLCKIHCCRLFFRRHDLHGDQALYWVAVFFKCEKINVNCCFKK